MNTIVITNGAKQSLPTSTVITSEAKQSRADKGKIAAPISWACNDVPIHTKHLNLRTQA